MLISAYRFVRDRNGVEDGPQCLENPMRRNRQNGRLVYLRPVDENDGQVNSHSPRRRTRYRHIWAVGLLLLVTTMSAMARQGEPPRSQIAELTPLTAVPAYALPAVDTSRLIQQDEARAQPGPLRVAVPVPVRVTPDTHGLWETSGDGTQVWRLRFEAPGATDLNFGFTRFRLPAGARLYVVSEATGYYEGPYTDADNLPHFQLWTPVVPGEAAFIEVELPSDSNRRALDLRLEQVGTGYRDFFGRGGRPNTGEKQGSCNIDVICPEGDPWRDEIRSVARILISGSALCTATLIMDEPGSFRPYLLSAAHCGITESAAPTVVAYWNFESPRCGQLSGGSLSDNQTGSTFRARRTDVDMSIVELDEMPAPSFRVYYAGWDRSGDAPDGSVAIHHPSADEKAITFNFDPLTTGNSCIGAGRNTHWYMVWEMGTTEPGSSGSGLWDPSTRGLVGFLSGGLASCANPGGYDCYGKLGMAWDGTGAATRLKDWLDPNDTGVTSVAGADPTYQPPWPKRAYRRIALDGEGLSVFRNYRDKFLNASEQGRDLVSRLYSEQSEIARLLLTHPSLAEQTADAVTDVLPLVQAILAGEHVSLPPSTQAESLQLLTAFEKISSPALRSLIGDARSILQDGDALSTFGFTQ